ncbi:hypothetical protein AB0M36_18865 [Actinoplanes sp. NPDC051346]|uniref:hypothetical protein n=1 Tax=Actinoplanes sp. NPDC051346 TaxID=3155048 RepID=UPI00342B328F
MVDEDSSFSAIVRNIRGGNDMATATGTDLSDAILTFVRDAAGRVMVRDLSDAMKKLGFFPDETADGISVLEQDGKIEPGGGAWVTLRRS